MRDTEAFDSFAIGAGGVGKLLCELSLSLELLSVPDATGSGGRASFTYGIEAAGTGRDTGGGRTRDTAGRDG